MPSTTSCPATVPPLLSAALQGVEPAGALLRLQALLGVVCIVALGWLVSSERRAVSWRIVFWGVALQVAFAWVVLRTPAGAALFQGVNGVVRAALGHSSEGARFLFGNLVADNVPVGAGEGTFADTPGLVARSGASFAFRVLPTIIFVSCLMAVLYHVGVMQRVVRGVAWVMRRTLGTSAAETLAGASNVFVGLMEAPLAVRPFLEGMTRSELMAVMAAGMATVSGGALAAYAGMLLPYEPDAAGHLIAASFMSAPAAFVLAKLMVPETETPATAGGGTPGGVATGSSVPEVERPDANVIGAAARGASEGLRLALLVGAMLIAFLALVSLANGVLGWGGGLVGLEALTLQGVLGHALVPAAWALGIPWGDAQVVGMLIGLEFVLNEFVAFAHFASLLGAGVELEPRSRVIAIYALTSFANFGSVAMTLAGLGALAPSRRHDLASLGLKAMAAGALATLLTAAVAGVVA